MKENPKKDAKPGGIKELMLPHTTVSVASEQKVTNPPAAEKTVVSKNRGEPHSLLPLQRPPLSASSSGTKPAIDDAGTGQTQKGKMEVVEMKRKGGEVEQGTEMVITPETTKETSAIVEPSSANLTSPQLENSAGKSEQRDNVQDGQSEEIQNTSSGTLIDEQVHTHTHTHARSIHLCSGADGGW